MSKELVLIRNDASCKIVGFVTIKIKIFDRTIRMLADVKHALDLKRNFISLSTLDSQVHW